MLSQFSFLYFFAVQVSDQAASSSSGMKLDIVDEGADSADTSKEVSVEVYDCLLLRTCFVTKRFTKREEREKRGLRDGIRDTTVYECGGIRLFVTKNLF